MFQEEGGWAVINRYGRSMDPELWRYYGSALKALDTHPKEPE